MLLIMDVKIKCIWIFLTNVFLKVDGWSCESTVTKAFSRVNTDAVLQFEISAYVYPYTRGSLYVKFFDNSFQALVIYNTGVIKTDSIPGVEVTADISGNVAITKENIGISNAGIYYISSAFTPTRCTCLYIPGTPTQPSVSVTGSLAVEGRVTLTCTSTSTTTPSNHSLSFMYSWRVDSTNNPTDPRYSYSTNRNTLTLSNIVKDDANKQFTCTATEDVNGGYTSSRSDSKSLNIYYTDVQSFYIKEHPGQDNVTVDEHDAHIEFKCIIDSNSASTTKITFEGNVIKVGMNVTLLSVSRKDVSCYDTGVYNCEGINDNGKISSKKIFLSVRCVPRPLDKVQRNVTSELHSSITLSFTAIAYPEPDPKGFAWHKEEDVGWVPLFSNNHLKISSSGLQSNLTVQNVSKEDYGNYRLTVTNDIGTYVQHFLLSGRISPDHTNSQGNCQQSERATIIVGITLGVVCCALASVAFYLNILRMRTNAKEEVLPKRSKKQSTFTNTSFASDVVERQKYENAATDQGEAGDQQQYTDFSRYANTDKDMYDVLKKT